MYFVDKKCKQKNDYGKTRFQKCDIFPTLPSDLSISIKYLHGQAQVTDLSVSGKSELEEENLKLTRVIDELKQENESLQTHQISSEDKDLIERKNLEIQRLIVFNESLEEEIMKLAVSRQTRKLSARENPEDIDEPSTSNTSYNMSIGSISSFSRRESIGKGYKNTFRNILEDLLFLKMNTPAPLKKGRATYFGAVRQFLKTQITYSYTYSAGRATGGGA